MEGSVYIDAHHHLWALGKNDYQWLTPDLEPLYRDFLPGDYCRASAGTPVKRAILVQADPSFRETQDLLALARQHEYIEGVIGWVDFDKPDIAIRQLQQLCTYPKFLGVRPMIQDIPDTKWMLNENFDPVFRYLIEENLCFEALVRAEHLEALGQLLYRYPSLRTVVDHAAKPDIANNDFENWRHCISSIARQTRAYCKLSGLLTEATTEQQHYGALSRYINCLIEEFGPQRLIWGSDWPVLHMASNYQHWWNISQQALIALKTSEQRAILGANASQFYQLPNINREVIA